MERQHRIEGNGNSYHDPSPTSFAEFVCTCCGKGRASANYHAQKNIETIRPVHKCSEKEKDDRCGGRHGLSLETHTLTMSAQCTVNLEFHCSPLNHLIEAFRNKNQPHKNLQPAKSPHLRQPPRRALAIFLLRDIGVPSWGSFKSSPFVGASLGKDTTPMHAGSSEGFSHV